MQHSTVRKLTIGIQNAKRSIVLTIGTQYATQYSKKIDDWNPKCKMQYDKKIDIWNELRIEI